MRADQMPRNSQRDGDAHGGSGSRQERLVSLPLPDGMARMESGALQIGDDWPGVFLRGDEALALVGSLRKISDHLEARSELGWMDSAFLRGFIKTLESCKAN